LILVNGKLYIHAVNIHQGGGQSLLTALIKAIKSEIVLSVDSRMPLPSSMPANFRARQIIPSILARLKAESWLRQAVTKDDVVLCFGNLPPLFRLRGRTEVFLQNRYLIEDVPLKGFPLKVRLRLEVERIWFTRNLMNADQFVVQTPTMKRLLEKRTQGEVPVRVLPFVADPSGYERNLFRSNGVRTIDFDFVYVASGEPHKNHQKLIEAWCLLAEEGVFPSLCLTLDEVRFVSLASFIESKRKYYSVKIVNVGVLSHDEVLTVYSKSGAAIYPSKFESFGLPLIEARQAGLPVLASELDYVRDALDPEQVFDPESPVSIARAVKRFMGKDEKPLPLLNASQFLASLFD